jgi:hypothetical protein
MTIDAIKDPIGESEVGTPTTFVVVVDELKSEIQKCLWLDEPV